MEFYIMVCKIECLYFAKSGQMSFKGFPSQMIFELENCKNQVQIARGPMFLNTEKPTGQATFYFKKNEN